MLGFEYVREVACVGRAASRTDGLTESPHLFDGRLDLARLHAPAVRRRLIDDGFERLHLADALLDFPRPDRWKRKYAVGVDDDGDEVIRHRDEV